MFVGNADPLATLEPLRLTIGLRLIRSTVIEAFIPDRLVRRIACIERAALSAAGQHAEARRELVDGFIPLAEGDSESNLKRQSHVPSHLNRQKSQSGQSRVVAEKY